MFTTRHQKAGLRLALKAGASVAVLAGAAMTATAQDSDATESADEYETIVVQGIRRSLETALERKRDADEVLDSITAVDIGALPDRSVAEALQRVPGIQLQRTSVNRDPARLSSEGGGVFVRGLRWVRTETNGRDIFSAVNGRSLSFEDVSSDLLAGVDVYKNPSAEQIEGGLGGIVNLRTRKPFDQDDQLIAGSLDVNYADLLDRSFFTYNGLYSDRWDTGAGEIGVLFSASVAEIGNRTDSIQTGRHEPRTLAEDASGFAAGDTVFFPTALGYRRIDWEQERDAFSGSVQWAPTPDLTFTAEALYTSATPYDVERAVLVNGGVTTGDLDVVDVSNANIDSRGVLVGGVVPGAALTYNTRITDRESSTGDYSFNVSYLPDSPWSVSADFQYVESDTELLSFTAFTQLGVEPFNQSVRPDVGFDLRGDSPAIQISDPDLLQDKSAYWWAAAMDHIEDNDAHSFAERIDIEYDFGDDRFLKNFRFGVRASQRTATTRQSGYNWQLLSNQFWGSGGGAPVYLGEEGVPPNAGLPDQSQFYAYNDFFRGDIANPGGGWFPTAGLLNDTQDAFGYLQSTLTSGWGWVPLTPDVYNTLNPQADNVSAGVNRQNEDTLAAYGVMRFGDDEGSMFGMRFDGNVGVRVVETETTALGRGVITGLDGSVCATVATPDCVSAAAFQEGFRAELGEFTEFTNSYTNVLPSANVRFFLNDDLQLRFAASRGMVRPDFSQNRPNFSLSYSFTDDIVATPDVFEGGVFDDLTGEAGAPNLDPIIADQFDASLEWYFSDSNSLTFAVFHKEIQDYIVLQNALESFTYGGETIDFVVQRQTNSEEGSLTGFELAYQQFYDFLPGAWSGLGLQANFTYIDNSGGANEALNPYEPAQATGATRGDLPIEGISRTSYNLTGIYENYGISARLAYNWRERYLLTTSAANLNVPVYWEDYGQLDGSVFYNVSPNFKVGIQGTNLLNTRTFLQVGDETLAPRYSWTDTDRRVALIGRFQY